MQNREALAALFGELDGLGPDPAVENLRGSAPEQDADGQPCWPGVPQPPTPAGATAAPAERKKRSEGVRFPHQANGGKKPTHAEVEQRIATLQLWIAQRLPTVEVRSRAQELWGISSTFTLDKYIRLARARMVEELIDNRLVHQAEQIYALMDCARRAADAEQFSAAVGAHRVIAEIAGMLRAPAKPYSERP
jgi:hypothetical protein